ncbi:Cuticle protein [Armadillidium vulgare]|nr:Cuticle protein [Armadillidium vulgare]
MHPLFTFPNGENFDLRYVADEGGYQPESSWIPVAPEFPHEIPDFVQEQIKRAAEEDATEPNLVDEIQFPIQ